MLLTNIPPPEQALAELAALTASLHEILPRAATEQVVPYFSRRGRPINERTATDMLRYETLWHIQQLGIQAEPVDEPSVTDDDPKLQVDSLPNNGIQGTFKDWPFKILRSRDGRIPPPGNSAKRRAYYNQIRYQQFPMFPADDYCQPRPNAVLLWNFDSTYAAVHLRLAIPTNVSDSGSVHCYCNVPVLDPTPRTSRTPNPGEEDSRVEPDVQLRDHLKLQDKQADQRYDSQGEDKASERVEGADSEPAS